MMTAKNKYKPAVNKNMLFLLAGLMWIIAGLMLLTFAYKWLTVYGTGKSWPLACGGLLCALTIHHFGFLRVVDKNLDRISKMEGGRCVFSFISWKSYLLVFIMAALGIILRRSSVPKEYLAIIYLSIGAALFFSSIRYVRIFLYQIKKTNQ